MRVINLHVKAATKQKLYVTSSSSCVDEILVLDNGHSAILKVLMQTLLTSKDVKASDRSNRQLAKHRELQFMRNTFNTTLCLKKRADFGKL